MKPPGKSKTPAPPARATRILHEFCLTVSSNRANIHKVSHYLSRIRHVTRIREELYANIMISLTEAVNNAIVHGNKEDPDKFVRVRCACYRDRFEFFIHDEGTGFDPDALPDPLAEENLLKEGGRGILIIRALMAEVTLAADQDGLTLHFTAFRSLTRQKS